MLPDMKDLSYEERLIKLKLPTLRFRRLRGDMIETYKIVTGVYDKRVTENILPLNQNIHQNTRGHSLKLTKQRSKVNFVFNKFDFLHSDIQDQ